MSGGFVKLYGTILDSSIWGEPLAVRIVWITMLAMADKDGFIGASSDGIARRANVNLKAADAALETLAAPDPRSKSPEYDGRRIERVDGGWRILNYEKYRELRTEKQIADAERQRRHRNGERDVSQESQPVATDAEADAEAKADLKETTSTTTGDSEKLNWIATLFPKPEAALAMLHGMTQGIGTAKMQAVDVDTLYEAATELGVAGGDVTSHRFKVFVNKILERRARVVAENPRSRTDARRPQGKTLAATQLIRNVRAKRNPEFPNSVLPGWDADFPPIDREVVKAFGIHRILNDTNEGTLVSQLAKALEEAA